ncbi:hypothetical protein OF83DRAFT_838424 [Amylostereum chailletii]|nr:hypothetical protein OF83DRAFT_838424 [Amylostereum chailletii]
MFRRFRSPNSPMEKLHSSYSRSMCPGDWPPLRRTGSPVFCDLGVFDNLFLCCRSGEHLPVQLDPLCTSPFLHCRGYAAFQDAIPLGTTTGELVFPSVKPSRDLAWNEDAYLKNSVKKGQEYPHNGIDCSLVLGLELWELLVPCGVWITVRNALLTVPVCTARCSTSMPNHVDLPRIAWYCASLSTRFRVLIDECVGRTLGRPDSCGCWDASAESVQALGTLDDFHRGTDGRSSLT